MDSNILEEIKIKTEKFDVEDCLKNNADVKEIKVKTEQCQNIKSEPQDVKYFKSNIVWNPFYNSKSQGLSGTVPLEEYKNIYVPPPSENWDEDPPEQTYDPLKRARNRHVLIFKTGMSKAKRKAFRKSECRRFRHLEFKEYLSNNDYGSDV